MKKFKHTPEPWRNKLGFREHVRFIYGGSKTIAELGAGPKGPREANACRIVECVNGCEGIADPSAVKDLLAACEGVAKCFSNDSEVWTEVRAVFAAIAKAKGE